MSKKDRETNRAARAAAIQKAQARKERNRNLLVVLVVVVVLVGGIAASVIFSGGGKDDKNSGANPKVAVSGQSLVVGNDPDAAVKVVIYEDFLCPFCREFEEESRGFLRSKAEKGKVLVEYRPFQLLQDEYSSQAMTAFAAIAEKGKPTQALAFHDLLFEEQPYENSPRKPDVDDLKKLAKKAGVEDSAVLDAISKENPAFLAAARATAEKDKVQGTPTIMVNGEEIKGSSVTDIADQVKKLIAQG